MDGISTIRFKSSHQMDGNVFTRANKNSFPINVRVLFFDMQWASSVTKLVPGNLTLLWRVWNEELASQNSFRNWIRVSSMFTQHSRQQQINSRFLRLVSGSVRPQFLVPPDECSVPPWRWRPVLGLLFGVEQRLGLVKQSRLSGEKPCPVCTGAGDDGAMLHRFQEALLWELELLGTFSRENRRTNLLVQAAVASWRHSPLGALLRCPWVMDQTSLERDDGAWVVLVHLNELLECVVDNWLSAIFMRQKITRKQALWP